jgi:hypothetical protein
MIGQFAVNTLFGDLLGDLQNCGVGRVRAEPLIDMIQNPGEKLAGDEVDRADSTLYVQ